MKKIIILSSIALLIGGAILVTFSCKKEKVKGCMDVDSKTFNSAAEEDDGSCAYEGKVLFWYGKTVSTSLLDDGATALTFYVDGKVVGSSAASVYFTSKPECGQTSSVTVIEDLGNVKNKSYTYSVKDDTGFEYWSGVANFTANTCAAIELTWTAKKKK